MCERHEQGNRFDQEKVQSNKEGKCIQRRKDGNHERIGHKQEGREQCHRPCDLPERVPIAQEEDPAHAKDERDSGQEQDLTRDTKR
jgi:hypothetical protein